MEDRMSMPDSFGDVCRVLGYEPGTVLNVRLNPRQAAVTYVDAEDALRTTAYGLPRRSDGGLWEVDAR